MRASSCPAPTCCPDLAWVPPQIVRLMVMQFVVIAVGGLVPLFMQWPSEGPEILALGLVHALVNFAGACSCVRTMHMKWAFQLILLVVFCTDAVTLSYMAGYAELGPMARGCVMGTTDVLVKLLAGSVMPMPIYLPFLLFTTANAIVSSHVVGAWHDQPVEPTQYAFIITTSIVALIHARAIQFWPAALQDVSGQLSREEDTVELLLPMVTEGTCWLASDADSIARSDDQFRALIGKGSGRRRLSDCAQEERQRLQGALAALAAARGPVEPRIIQATIGFTRVQRVELVIVDRRAAQARPGGSAARERSAFLVGVARVAREPGRVLGPRAAVPESADGGRSMHSPSVVAASPSSGSGSSASASSAAVPQPSAPVRPGAPAGPPARQVPPPAGRAARPCPAQPSARLPELRELAVEFDALSPHFTVRSCTLHFAREAVGLQLPLLMDFLQAPNAAAFKTWAQEQANAAFVAEEGAEETTLPVPGSCQVVFSVPTLGMKLVGESAELHIAPDEELEEPEVLATLRLRDLTQLRRRRHRERRAARGGNNLGNANPRLRPNGLRTIDESRMHSGTTPDNSLEQAGR